MNFKKNTVGIWGFGLVGKAALQFFSGQAQQILVMNNKSLTPEQEALLTKHNARFIDQAYAEQFLTEADFIVPSPGIDLSNYQQYHEKFLAELDIFQQFSSSSIIAVTGTVGKTSVTHLLSQLISPHVDLVTGGNIGMGMLGLLQKNNNTTLLEVSSFQLELCRTFAPDLAIWTNFFANHLDRHTTEHNYFTAKAQLVINQTAEQHALLPLVVAQQLRQQHTLHSQLTIFSQQEPMIEEQNQFPAHTAFLYCEHKHIVIRRNGNKKRLIAMSDIPNTSFVENWLIIIGALTLLKLPVDVGTLKLQIPEHRCETVATKNGVTFVNDSKSTLMQATLSAVSRYNADQVILLLGGLSKGVDRGPMIAQLPRTIKQIICFGAEAEHLQKICSDHRLKSRAAATLEEAFDQALNLIKKNDIVLLSPGGSSFDLFDNYQCRGQRFKELVNHLYKGSYDEKNIITHHP